MRSTELTEVEVAIIKASAKCNLNITQVCKEAYITRNAVKYHRDKIKEKTGLDFKIFYDEVKLLEMIGEGENIYAEWTYDEYKIPSCSHCGETVTLDGNEEYYLTRYCPFCGAEMKNGE